MSHETGSRKNGEERRWEGNDLITRLPLPVLGLSLHIHLKGRNMNVCLCAMSPIVLFLVLQLLGWRNSNGCASAHERRGDGLVTARPVIKVGAVLDLGSRMGKEHKIAMEIAVQDFNRLRSSKLLLNFHDSRGNSATTVAAGNFPPPCFHHLIWIWITFRNAKSLYQISYFLIFFYFTKNL